MSADKRKPRRKSTARPRGRANGEGSIYPYRDGYAAYVWVTTPSGERARKYVYGPTREIVHDKWVKLQAQADRAPVPTSTPTLAQYLARWLAEVVEPNLELATYAYYEAISRLYISPALGRKRIDRLQVREVQTWLNKLARSCQCCVQGKDAARPEDRRRCCADRRLLPGLPRPPHGAGSAQHPPDGPQPRQGLRRTGLPERRGHGQGAQPAAAPPQRLGMERRGGQPLPRLGTGARRPAVRRLRPGPGQRPAEGRGPRPYLAQHRRGRGRIDISWQLQRIGRQLIHKKRVKTEDSDADDTVPLPDICSAALKLRRDEQEAARQRAGDRWQPSDLVFTTKWGTPIEPRNFNRSFDSRCTKADVPRIRVHDTRHTCASILAALDVHPRVAMRILRHAQISMTMEVYTEVPDKITRAALKKLGDSLGRPAARPAPPAAEQDQS